MTSQPHSILEMLLFTFPRVNSVRTETTVHEKHPHLARLSGVIFSAGPPLQTWTLQTTRFPERELPMAHFTSLQGSSLKLGGGGVAYLLFSLQIPDLSPPLPPFGVFLQHGSLHSGLNEKNLYPGHMYMPDTGLVFLVPIIIIIIKIMALHFTKCLLYSQSLKKGHHVIQYVQQSHGMCTRVIPLS